MDGRELTSRTEYIYSDDGLLVHTITTHEAAWTEMDRAELLALQEYRSTLCECCGLPKSMTQVHERDAPRFVVEHPMCQARRTMIDAQKPFRDPKESEKHPEWGAYVWKIRVKE